jgi:polyribonucleotide nucleotidyltransferase
MVKQYKTTFGDTEIVIETGKLAPQAGGAVTVRLGDSMVLVTATASNEPREGGDFFPLTVDFEERRYAAGKIPGGFFKREGRPSTESILLCRMIDRPLRPLFPKGYRNDVHVIVTALSADQEHHIDMVSAIGASAALTISDIPFMGPIGAVRVGYIDGEYVINPTMSQMTNSTLDLTVAGTAESVLMIEAGATDEFPEDMMLEAIRRGHEAMQDVIALQRRMAEEIGKEKNPGVRHVLDEQLVARVRELASEPLAALVAEGASRRDRREEEEAIRKRMLEQLGPDVDAKEAAEAFEGVFKDLMRRRILDTGIRVDGRDLKTIRPLHAEVGLLPRTHGSGLFSRGETQVLSIATLGTASDEQTIESLSGDTSKSFMHHYNFPPYSTGEVYPLRGPRRREIGHGALAERALEPMLPVEGEFPYTIRVVSEVLSSNGSTSMASTCACTLALLDAGVPLRAAVAGIAMGVITEGDRWAVLTDIQGLEDHLGDMDFKVAGTAKGITAIQLDIKISGLRDEIIGETLRRAREARLQILDAMNACISRPREELSAYAPRIQTLQIPISKIGALIGPGGKTIRSITEETGVKIDVEDDGTVYIASVDGNGASRALRRITELTATPEIGRIYTGKVVRTTEFGAFVEILPGQDGLVHISQLADYRVPKVEDVVQVGDEIMVMIIDIDPQGKIKLSRQAVLEGWTAEEARARDRRPSGPPRGGSSDRRGGGGSRYDRERSR